MLRLLGLWCALCLPLLWGTPLRAYSIPTHERISEDALCVFEAAYRRRLPHVARQAFLRGSAEPDAQLANKFLYWHFPNTAWFRTRDAFDAHSPLDSARNCDRPMADGACAAWETGRRRPHFGYRFERYVDALVAEGASMSEARFQSLGAIAHYVQDMHVPDHVVPIYHLGENPFDNLLEKIEHNPPAGDCGCSGSDEYEKDAQELHERCKSAREPLACALRALTKKSADDTRDAVRKRPHLGLYYRSKGEPNCVDGDFKGTLDHERPSPHVRVAWLTPIRRNRNGFGCYGPAAMYTKRIAPPDKVLELFDIQYVAAVRATVILLRLAL